MSFTTIEPINPNVDKPLIRRCMLEWYYPYDSILLATGRTNPGEAQIENILDGLSDGKSMKAINSQDGHVVGFVIAFETNAEADDKFRRSMNATQCEYFRKVLKFYLIWESETHFREILPGWTNWLTIQVIAVNPAYRRNGIMTSLIDSCVRLANRSGYPGITIDISSYYTAKCVQKLGWDCIFTLPFVAFNDRIDETRQFFKRPIHPHHHVSTYCLKF